MASCLLVLLLAVPAGRAAVEDYLALMNGDPNLPARWGMEPSDPYANSAKEPFLKK